MKELHCLHHMQVDRTLSLVRNFDSGIKRKAIRRAARRCSWFQLITHIKTNWMGLAIEVTHYQKRRIVITSCNLEREMQSDNAVIIVGVNNEIFLD